MKGNYGVLARLLFENIREYMLTKRPSPEGQDEQL